MVGKKRSPAHGKPIYINKRGDSYTRINTDGRTARCTACQSSQSLSRRPRKPEIHAIKIGSVQFWWNGISQRWKLSSWLTARCDTASFRGVTGVHGRAFTSDMSRERYTAAGFLVLETWLSLKPGGASRGCSEWTVDGQLYVCLFVCLSPACSVSVCVSGGFFFGTFMSASLFALETNVGGFFCFWGCCMWLSDLCFYTMGPWRRFLPRPPVWTENTNSSLTQLQVDRKLPPPRDAQNRKRRHLSYVFASVYAWTNLSMQPTSVTHQKVFDIWG